MVEQETDFYGIAGTWNSLKWGPGSRAGEIGDD